MVESLISIYMIDGTEYYTNGDVELFLEAIQQENLKHKTFHSCIATDDMTAPRNEWYEVALAINNIVSVREGGVK